MTLDLRRAGPGADEGRREPAVRDRGRRDPAHDRAAAARDALGRDGAEGGRRALRRAGRHGRLRRAVGARAAGLRRARAAADLAAGLLPGAERRLGARRARAARRCAAAPRALRTFVQGAFAHRRKALAKSVALAGVRLARSRARRAGGARRADRRARGAARAASGCGSCGRRCRSRARSRAAAERAGAGAGREMTGAATPARARAGQDEPRACSSARRAPTGCTSWCRVIEPLSLADELTLEPLPGGALVAAAPGVGDAGCAAGGTRSSAQASRARTSPPRRWQRYRAASGWDGPPLRLTIVKRVPVAAGMGGGSGDAAAALRLAAHAAGRPRRSAARAARPAARRRRAVAGRARRRCSSAAPASTCEPLSPLPGRTACSCCPRRTRSRRPTSSARLTGSGCRAPPQELRAACGGGGCARTRRAARAARQRPRAGRSLAVPVDRRRARRRARGRRRPRARVRLRSDGRRALLRRATAAAAATAAAQRAARAPSRTPIGARPVDVAFAAVRGGARR